jgi:hypothetical protein
MRQWNVPTKFLCTKHLLGEHVESHMYVGCIKKGTSLKGYIEKGLVEVHNIKNRHNELVLEMIKRGFNHKSPLEEFNCYDAGYVNSEQNINELKNRCKSCRERILNDRE